MKAKHLSNHLLPLEGRSLDDVVDLGGLLRSAYRGLAFLACVFAAHHASAEPPGCAPSEPLPVITTGTITQYIYYQPRNFAHQWVPYPKTRLTFDNPVNLPNLTNKPCGSAWAMIEAPKASTVASGTRVRVELLERSAWPPYFRVSIVCEFQGEDCRRPPGPDGNPPASTP